MKDPQFILNYGYINHIIVGNGKMLGDLRDQGAKAGVTVHFVSSDSLTQAAEIAQDSGFIHNQNEIITGGDLSLKLKE